MKPRLLKSRDFGSLIHAPNHCFETNDLQKIRSFTKQCFITRVLYSSLFISSCLSAACPGIIVCLGFSLYCRFGLCMPLVWTIVCPVWINRLPCPLDYIRHRLTLACLLDYSCVLPMIYLFSIVWPMPVLTTSFNKSLHMNPHASLSRPVHSQMQITALLKSEWKCCNFSNYTDFWLKPMA